MSNQQDTKKKNPNVPTLRFGIGGQKRPLRDVVVFPKSTASCPKNIYISTENLKQDFQGFVAYQDNSLSKGISFKEGDTLFANIRPYLKKAFLASFNGCCSPDVICFRPAGILPGYLYYAIANEHFTDHVMEACKGSKMPRGDRSWMLQKEIFVPSEEEQMKVVSFLRLIDQRIETQNKIIEELLALKKALYNKVFGTDAFNCRDIALHHFMKMPDKVREMHPDRHKLITVRLNEGGVIKNTNVETLKMASTIYYRRSAGQFIYGKQNIFHGAFGIVPCHLDGYASSGDVPALDFKEGVNSSFLMRSLSFSCYNWEKYASGTGSKRIHEKNCLNCKFECPHWALSKDSKKCSQP